jgi:hypothetical protein
MSVEKQTTAEDWDKLKSPYWKMAEEESRDNEVHQPEHYNYGSIECIEAIEESMTDEAFNGYLKGNCLKYIWRYQRKGKPLQDLEKARWYLDKLISRFER